MGNEAGERRVSEQVEKGGHERRRERGTVGKVISNLIRG